MKNVVFGIMLLFFVAFKSIVYGQDLESERLDSLRIEAAKLEEDINKKTELLSQLKVEIKHLENQDFLAKINMKNDGFTVFTTLKMNGKIRKSDDPISKLLAIVLVGDSLKLTDYSNGYWIVNKGQYFGYINDMYLNETEEVLIFKEEIERQNKQYRKRELAEKAVQDSIARELEIQSKEIRLTEERLAAERQLALEKKERQEYERKVILEYGSEIGQQLLDGYYWIGMTGDMALVSLGNPWRINKSVGSWGVHEQWVYSSTYLYFENGILDSYQNSR